MTFAPRIRSKQLPFVENPFFPSSCRDARQRETNIRSIFHLSPQMGHARPPAGLINRVQDAGTVRKNMSSLALFTLFMAIAKLSRTAEREKNKERETIRNALFYRGAEKNIRRDSFRTEKYLSIIIVARRLRADKNTFAACVYAEYSRSINTTIIWIIAYAHGRRERGEAREYPPSKNSARAEISR